MPRDTRSIADWLYAAGCIDLIDSFPIATSESEPVILAAVKECMK